MRFYIVVLNDIVLSYLASSDLSDRCLMLYTFFHFIKIVAVLQVHNYLKLDFVNKAKSCLQKCHFIRSLIPVVYSWMVNGFSKY